MACFIERRQLGPLLAKADLLQVLAEQLLQAVLADGVPAFVYEKQGPWPSRPTPLLVLNPRGSGGHWDKAKSTGSPIAYARVTELDQLTFNVPT